MKSTNDIWDRIRYRLPDEERVFRAFMLLLLLATALFCLHTWVLYRRADKKVKEREQRQMETVHMHQPKAASELPISM